MGRHAYPLSPAALEEIRRFVETGTRRHAIAGAPRAPSVREIAVHLFARKLTPQQLNAGVLWRACRANGIELPARAPSLGRHRRIPKWLKGTAGAPSIIEMEGASHPGRCRVGKAQARGAQA